MKLAATRGRIGGMAVFSPFARAVMDGFAEAVVLFDGDGRMTYANAGGKRLLDSMGDTEGQSGALLPRLGRRGGRVERLAIGGVLIGHAVYLPAPAPDADPATLADRERAAIEETLDQTGWRLTETARRLGISRTTLWRRMRDWDLKPLNGQTPGE